MQNGDSLSKIAKREYGDAQQWRRIYEANRDLIQNPDLIYPGQVFRIPKA
ncbi:MAG TPA: LysM peptidoglycan-binding domain-containing protein [Gemmatimonadales bacterium]|nr:LysM peptidoglycan-binding domain-containing protein [Gemmatimonadales bacterium]